MEFKSGDVVRLKSSKQLMTVSKELIKAEGLKEYECVWFTDDGTFGKNHFVVDTLVKEPRIVGE